MSNIQLSNTCELSFLLEIEDGWPPATHESLPCNLEPAGYRIKVAPFFVKEISSGDLISVVFNKDNEVLSWKSIEKSGRTTIWISRLSREYAANIEKALAQLRLLKCNTSELPQFGLYTIDVPEDCNIKKVDECLEYLDPAHVCIAFPSFRHQEQ